MKKNFLFLLIALGLIVQFPSMAQTPTTLATSVSETADIEEEPQGFIINFNNIGIIEYIRFISQISNKNFIFDDADLNFKVTIVSEEPTSLDNIMTALMQVLRIQGLSLIEEGNNILIHRNSQVSALATISDDTDDKKRDDSEIVTKLFHLQYTKPTTLAPVIQPLVSNPAAISVLPDTGHIIVTDLSRNVDKIAELIASIDSPGNYDIAQYAPKDVAPATLLELANSILAPISQQTSINLILHEASGSIFVASSPKLTKIAIAVLKVIDTSKGSTMLLNKELLESDDLDAVLQKYEEERVEKERVEKERVEKERIAREIREDTPSTEDLDKLLRDQDFFFEEESKTAPGDQEEEEDFFMTTEFSAYKLRYLKGDQIQQALSELATNLRSGVNAKIDDELYNTIRSVQWIEDNNALLLSGSSKNIQQVKKLVDVLDQASRQVFIEMLVIQTTVSNSLQFGVQSGYRAESPDFAGSMGFVPSTGSSPLPAALSSVTLDGNPSASTLSESTGFTLGVIGKILTHNGEGFSTLGSLMTALNSDRDTDIILNPKILAEDNTAAEVFVGENIRYRGQSISNDDGSIITTNFEYRDVGTTFKVVPHLGSSDVITMDIEQEISVPVPVDSTEAAIAAEAGPETTKNKTTTRIHVPNQYFVIMSGMIQDQTTLNSDRVPCLGGLPFIGAAFTTQTKSVAKRNVMIFIRPTIVDTADEMEEVTHRQQDIFRDSKRRPDPLKFEIDNGLEFLNLKSKG